MDRDLSGKTYDQMTHDEILKEHTTRYAAMTPNKPAHSVFRHFSLFSDFSTTRDLASRFAACLRRLADSVPASVTYPSGKTVSYTVKNAERLTAAVDNASGTQFVANASYMAPSLLASLVAGQVNGGFGGVTEAHSYNNRMEYTSTSATSSAGTALNLTLSYNLAGGDNSSLSTIANYIDNGRTLTFGYDPLNRISSVGSQATSGADCWGQGFTPDSPVKENGK